MTRCLPGNSWQRCSPSGVSINIDDWILPVLLISAVFTLGLALNWRDNRRATSLIVLGTVLHPLFITSLGLPFVPFYISDLQERHFIVFAPFIFAGSSASAWRPLCAGVGCVWRGCLHAPGSSS